MRGPPVFSSPYMVLSFLRCDPGYALQHEELGRSALIERDEKCYSITWNAPRNCSFDLETTHCGRSLRYICEAPGETA